MFDRILFSIHVKYVLKDEALNATQSKRVKDNLGRMIASRMKLVGLPPVPTRHISSDFAFDQQELSRFIDDIANDGQFWPPTSCKGVLSWFKFMNEHFKMSLCTNPTDDDGGDDFYA